MPLSGNATSTAVSAQRHALPLKGKAFYDTINIFITFGREGYPDVARHLDVLSQPSGGHFSDTGKSPSSLTDSDMKSDVIRKFNNGDHEAFRAIFDRYYKPLYSFVYAIVGNQSKPEDIVQDIFMTLWTKRMDFESEQKLKSFLFVIARNKAINLLRSSDLRLRAKQFTEIDTDNYLDNYNLVEEFDLKLKRWLDALPEGCRKIMELFLDDCSNAQIAEKLDLSVSTVKNQKVKALKILRRMYPSDALSILLFSKLFL